MFEHDTSGIPKRYLTLDVAQDNVRFRSGLAAFQDSISCSNLRKKKDIFLRGKTEVPVELTMTKPCLEKEPKELEEPGDQKNQSDPGEPKVSQPDEMDFIQDILNTPLPPGPAARQALTRHADTARQEIPPQQVEQAEQPEQDEPDISGPHESVLNGFDMDGFNEIVNYVKQDLDTVDRSLDLNLLALQVNEYKVDLDLANHEERLSVLGDKMLEVQAKIDSIRTPLGSLTAWAQALEKAWKYIEGVGLLYSRASNKEKREAQVKLALRGLWLEYTRVTRLRDSYKNVFDSLGGQRDVLSRIMTYDMSAQRVYRGISGGELSFEEKGAIREEIDSCLRECLTPALAASLVQSALGGHAPAGPVARDEPARAVEKEVPEAPRPLCPEPSNPEDFKALDLFPRNAVAIVDESKKIKKGIVNDWDDF